MFKWLFHILIFATYSGKYQNKEKPLKHQRKLGLCCHKLSIIQISDNSKIKWTSEFTRLDFLFIFYMIGQISIFNFH